MTDKWVDGVGLMQLRSTSSLDNSSLVQHLLDDMCTQNLT